MKSITKFLAYTLLGLLLIVGALILYLKFSFDPNQFKSQLVQIVKEKKQRDLSLDGPMSLEFFPNLGVKLERVRLSAQASSDEFASVGKAHVSLALLPLLKRQLHVKALRLDDLNLHVKRNRDGASNVDDFLQSETSSSSPMQFDIQGIHLSNASIRIEDEAAQTRMSLSKLNLKTGHIADGVFSPLELESQIQMQKQGLLPSDFFLSLQSQISFNLKTQILQLQRSSLNVKGNVVGNKSLLTLSLPQLLIGLKTPQLSFQTLEAKLETHLNPEQSYVVNIRLPQMLYENSILNGDDVFIGLSGIGTNPLEMKLDVKKVLGKLDKVRFEDAQLSYEVTQKEQQVSAKLKAGVQANLLQASLQIQEWKGNLQVKNLLKKQLLFDMAMKGEAHADLATQAATIKLNAHVDETQMQAHLQMQGGKELQMQLNVHLSKLNLDRYLSKSDASTAVSQPKPMTETPFNLSVLKGINVTGQIEIDEFQAQQIKLSAVTLPVRLQHGFFESRDMSAQLYGGSVRGKLSINAHDAVFDVAHDFKQIQISPLLQAVLNKDVVEGRGDLSLNLRTQGLLPAQLKENLSGKVNFSLRDGAVKGINLAKSLRDFKAKIVNRNDQQQAANKLEKTDFSSLTASIDFKKGIGTNQDLSMMSPFLRVSGSGQVDLPKNSLDYVAKATVVNTATGQEGKDLAELKDLSIPVRIVGPFDHLNYQLQFAQISSEALKSALKAKAAPVIEEQKKELKEKLNEEVKNKLKGFLNKN